MTYQLVKDRTQMGKELRCVVVDTLQSLIDEDQSILALEADLGGASGFTNIQKTHPENFLQCGIAEANMVGVAAGLSLVGYQPFIHTFAPFATRRVFDQLYVSGGYAKTTLHIYGSDPGFTVGLNGGTHTSFEDIALMRTIPDAVICDAADMTQMEWILRTFAKRQGIHYVRGNRKAVRNIYAEGSTFTIGQASVLNDGQDILVISSGQLLSETLDCAEQLERRGYSVAVLDVVSIKPLDISAIIKHAQGKKLIVTFENHSIIGGLGSAVAEVLAENEINIPFQRFGIRDHFGQVGSPKFLQEEFHLTAIDLEKAIIKRLESK